MSEQIDVQTPSELEVLQKRAAQLNITIDGRWGVEKLREVVNAAVSGERAAVPVTVAAPAQAAVLTPAPAAAAVVESDEIKSPVAPTPSLMPNLTELVSAAVVPADETEGQRKNRLRRDAQALVRINVSCMNPTKKNQKGELICVSNRNFGTIQRFVPFNRDWHIEKVLYDALMEKEYMVFDSEKTGRANIEVKTARNVPEFNIRVLPPLSKGELKDLAQRQAMASGTGE